MGTAEIYEPLRPLLFSIAYRMLGTVSDAEGIVARPFSATTAPRPGVTASTPRRRSCPR
jgi:hypothetical protein